MQRRLSHTLIEFSEQSDAALRKVKQARLVLVFEDGTTEPGAYHEVVRQTKARGSTLYLVKRPPAGPAHWPDVYDIWKSSPDGHARVFVSDRLGLDEAQHSFTCHVYGWR